MFDVMIAGIRIRFPDVYEVLRGMCADYIVPDDGEPDLTTTALTWERLRLGAPEEDETFLRALDSDSMKRLWVSIIGLYPLLPQYDAFFLHSVLIEMRGEGFLLTAESGYGKTTQAGLWKARYPGETVIINGDEPVIRRCGDSFLGYGTPFCGKEGYQVRTSVPIHGICWLRHGIQNRLDRIEPSMAYVLLIRNYQGIIELSADLGEKYQDLLAAFADNVPAYILTCNQELQAAETAYEGMKAGWERFQKEKQYE